MDIKCQDLYFAYNKDDVIKKINLEIKSGQLTSIVGPNGIGKSTLLKCLCNIYKPKHGVVYLNGKEIVSMNSRTLAKNLAYVPQKQAISFSMTVYEMILLGRRPYIKWKVSANDEAIVESILNKFKIMHLAEREINTLSGGEKQKVAIARALAQEPNILFLDEPTSSLDINHQLEVIGNLRRLVYQESKAVVVVLHDLNLANRFSDKVFLMGKDGFYKEGSPEEVLSSENIKDIYNLEVEIIKTSQGKYIIPLDTGIF
ncbi:ABC transporter ATP-binding protein [Halocella sp. SP3-1]|uniref:ABC transporter ATP-binding protein n=1 Tax=Halocella sp. SP3-1 TaxID=2382161 RepID=UPI000F750435|nr:ABC transporter ATP-binding protein [Halocella sp. SP3-1]AZO95932.1 ABC transporter ATP-binding protein [Halocella sp. SP3-1]